ncbi:uncharacterized protein N7529_003948 [Penicillium soppii]|uniref:uncharacterized protein n=1 Tax=Penicillium soppii TaxID=69789 RepID=UPI0025484AB7|nr:uncharacterized protein N7529_003948 [Penicillium soppii]KAJ5871595.1 hypothetical protein N7529_003948 [Penicillium soppii]
MDTSLKIEKWDEDDQNFFVGSLSEFTNDRWEHIGPVSNLNLPAYDVSTPPSAVSPVESSEKQAATTSPPIKSSEVNSSTTLPPISPIKSSKSNNSSTSPTVSPNNSSKADKSTSPATSVASTSDSQLTSDNVGPSSTTITPPEKVKVFTFSMSGSRAQPEVVPSGQNTKRVTKKKKQDGQIHRVQEEIQPKTPVQTVWPPTPQSTSQSQLQSQSPIAPARAVPPRLIIDSHDPSIRGLQASYEAKIREVRIEYHSKLRAQYEHRERQATHQDLHVQRQPITMQPSTTMQQPTTIQQPTIMQHPNIMQLPKIMETERQLEIYGQKLKIATEEFYRKRDAHYEQRIPPLERRVLNEQYRAHLRRCHEHKERTVQFENFKHQLLLQQQQLQAVPKFQPAQIPAASQLLAAHHPTPHTVRTQSISSVSSTAAPKRYFSFVDPIVPDDKFEANLSNHEEWSFTPGDHTYLNGSQPKKYKYDL